MGLAPERDGASQWVHGLCPQTFSSTLWSPLKLSLPITSALSLSLLPLLLSWYFLKLTPQEPELEGST